ncbi:hypothetical protein GCM10007320_08970 [Pseudorhodoferax aquiterrae]|uniref:Bacteriophage CI repressor-like protein n=1 Tax=Pseudorhodoferax aquiterrae TaxID=747304 RepID=A0ABQ3FWI6_9BURK|nr:hypothetical protein [Pseudorhodoferax aquiterrae]GHC72825.1 hypothetical protein GCM10007320_08970 [Pseudorhodoferax aquiterrae]
METYERYQALLLLLRKTFSGNNSARLAELIDKDASYVRRLFYPRSKAGAKGIGPDLQAVCIRAFNLPRGFWEMSEDEAAAAIGVQTDGPAPARNLSDAARARPKRLSSEYVAAYVEDVGQLVGELAQSLNVEQRSVLRTLLRVMLSDAEGLQKLDFRQLLPLLSDNYRAPAAALPLEPYERRLDIQKHLDTIPRESDAEGKNHGTDSDAGAFEEGRPARRSGKA